MEPSKLPEQPLEAQQRAVAREPLQAQEPPPQAAERSKIAQQVVSLLALLVSSAPS